MDECRSVAPLVTPYVDGELARPERDAVDHHVRVCPLCRARVVAEQAVRDLIRARKSALAAECASAPLRASVDRAVREVVLSAAVAPRSAWHQRLAPLALAATLVVVVGGAFVYQTTARSSRVMAAELTADHVKCFTMNQLLGKRDGPAIVESAMQSGFGWTMHVPPELLREGLELIGSRPCLYGEGKVAHIMCRHNGQPVSIFMLPQSTRAEELLDVMGHRAKIWSAGGRTFVLIAREPRAEVEHMASVVQAALH